MESGKHGFIANGGGARLNEGAASWRCTEAKRFRILLIGFYGRGNFGDDLMGRALAEYALGALPCHISIAAAQPTAFSDLPHDSVRVVPNRTAAIMKALCQSDALCLGGGTHFHDSYRGVYLVRHWLTLVEWLALLWAVHLTGKKVSALGVGIGPLRHPVSRGLSRMALAACTAINTRDAASANELKSIGVDRPVFVGADLGVLSRLFGVRHAGLCIRESTPTLGVSACTLTPFLNDAEKNKQYWLAMGDALARFLQMQPVRLKFFSLFSGASAERDEVTIDLIVSRLPHGIAFDHHVYEGNLREHARHFADCDWYVATKYHAAVAAYLAGCECAIVTYNRKLADLADEIGLPPARRMPADRVQSRKSWDALFASFLSSSSRSSPDEMHGLSQRVKRGLNETFAFLGLEARSRECAQ